MSSRSVFLGWLAAAALASTAWAQGQEDSGKPAQIVLRPAAVPVPRSSTRSCPSIARWCRATRRFFIIVRSS